MRAITEAAKDSYILILLHHRPPLLPLALHLSSSAVGFSLVLPLIPSLCVFQECLSSASWVAGLA